MKKLVAFFAVAASAAFGSTVVFHGGAGCVGGSCATVRGGGSRLLVDCGTSYEAEYASGDVVTNSGTACGFPFLPRDYGHLLLTHAHQDHIGRVPELFNAGFTGTVWCTRATRDLAAVSWKSQIMYDGCAVRDWIWTRTGKKARITVHWRGDCEWAQKISPQNAGRFRGVVDDLQKHLELTPMTSWRMGACATCQDLELRGVLSRVQTVRFDHPVKMGPFTVTFSAVKHLPGAAAIRVEDGEAAVLFSGDLGSTRSRLVKSIEPARKADAVFVECTYGDASYGTAEDAEREYGRFIDVVADTVKAGGVAWIPAFALDRSQRVLLAVKDGMDDGRIPGDTPVYCLSSSAREYASLYAAHPKWFDDPGDMKRLGELLKGVRKSLSKTAKLKKGAILVTSSGNMSAGSSQKYLPTLLPRETTAVCLVGYQTPGTPGWQLQQIARGKSKKTKLGVRDGAKTAEVQVRAKVYDFNCFSGHGDARENDAWLANNRDSRIMLVHGEMDGMKARERGLRTRVGCGSVEVVEPGREYSFGGGKKGE